MADSVVFNVVNEVGQQRRDDPEKKSRDKVSQKGNLENDIENMQRHDIKSKHKRGRT